MTRRRSMMASLPTHLCATRPQWVKCATVEQQSGFILIIYGQPKTVSIFMAGVNINLDCFTESEYIYHALDDALPTIYSFTARDLQINSEIVTEDKMRKILLHDGANICRVS